jgi:hypothetical protein
MELLKVFVGDGTNTGTTVATMVKGDLLLLNASDRAPWSSGDAVIAGCNDSGVYFSTPIKAANIKWSGYKAPVTYAPKEITFLLAESAYGSTSASSTYSLGIQIKEDLRMGTYNKNTEVIASHTTPSTAVSTIHEVASTLAKGFAANPLTSAGSPYDLVKVVREAVAGTTMTALANNATVTLGAREVSCTAHALTVGSIVNLGGNVYLVESVRSANIFGLDTAYQGPSATLTAGTTAGTSAAGSMSSVQVGNIRFRFTAIDQTQQNRYDQFRNVEFDVIYPKGWTASTSVPTLVNATTQPVGSYRQVRDLEEKAYTNANPLINYREFPFQTFPINADPTLNNYGVFTLVYDAGWGYNMMQSSNPIFPQTVVVCSPVTTGVAGSDGRQFDSSGTGTTFAEQWIAFAGTPLLDGNTFPNLANT